MENIKEFAEKLSNLTILECYQLAKIMKDDYGIEPKTKILGVNVIPIPTLVADKTNFAVILKSVGTGSKLTLVKTVKEMMGNSLLEAKTLVDNAPSTLKENISKDEAIALEASLREIGAEVEVL